MLTTWVIFLTMPTNIIYYITGFLILIWTIGNIFKLNWLMFGIGVLMLLLKLTGVLLILGVVGLAIFFYTKKLLK
jgi:hypothetical protein